VHSQIFLLQLYPAEMSTRYTRGGFVVINQLALTVGTFIAQLIGNYISYYWLAVISLALTLVFVLTATTIKETPRWLMTQNRKQEARKVLTWLRGPNYDVEQELQDIEDRIMAQDKLTLVQTLKQFKSRSVYYPVILASFIMFFRQFSGIVAVLFNAEDIFKQAGVKSPGLTSSLSTGGVQIIASLVGVFIADLFGRRILMIGSCIIMFLAHGAMGVYEFLNNKPYCDPPNDSKCKDHLYPLAIVSIAIFVACYSAGLSAASRLVMPEIIPLRVRGVGVGIALFVSWGSSVIIGALFDNYQEAVKPYGAYWTFSLICLLAALFVAIFIPETKGKSLEDIERTFMDKRSRRLNLQ